MRAAGWILVSASSLILLYAVYLTWFTGLATAHAQRGLQTQWTDLAAPRTPDGAPPVGPPDGAAPPRDRAVSQHELEPGAAFAALWFERDGHPTVTDHTLYVVEGVGHDQLRRGPGHYPDTAQAGTAGNVAIAGHRTTYGAPFGALNELRHGDTIHLVDVHGTEWIYQYDRQQIVHPTDTWVLDHDPLGTTVPTLTLTTCHPRHSADQRLVVFAELAAQRPANQAAPGP